MIAPSPKRVVHKSPYREWVAFQEGRAVIISDCRSPRYTRFKPPVEWGSAWAWNFTEDDAGIYFSRG